MLRRQWECGGRSCGGRAAAAVGVRRAGRGGRACGGSGRTGTAGGAAAGGPAAAGPCAESPILDAMVRRVPLLRVRVLLANCAFVPWHAPSPPVIGGLEESTRCERGTRRGGREGQGTRGIHSLRKGDSRKSPVTKGGLGAAAEKDRGLGESTRCDGPAPRARARPERAGTPEQRRPRPKAPGNLPQA